MAMHKNQLKTNNASLDVRNNEKKKCTKWWKKPEINKSKKQHGLAHDKTIFLARNISSSQRWKLWAH